MIKVNRRNGQAFSQNIVNEAMNFDSGTWNVVSGNGTASLDATHFFNGESSLEIFNFTPNSNIVVSNNNQDTSIVKTGRYQISFYAKKDIDEVRDGNLLIYKNAVLLDTQPFSLEDNEEWFRYQCTQEYTFSKGDVITFQFQLNAVTTTETTTKIYVDGFMVNVSERNYKIAPQYNSPLKTEKITGWESRSDSLNTLTLTANTDNVMQLTGTSQSNGGLVFFDSNAKIIPIGLNDLIQIDFACTFETPSGTDNMVDVKLKVGANYYRGYSYNLTKGSGVDDIFSVSWSIPCGSETISNGIELVLNPNVAVDYKERYLAVSRTHKGV